MWVWWGKKKGNSSPQSSLLGISRQRLVSHRTPAMTFSPHEFIKSEFNIDSWTPFTCLIFHWDSILWVWTGSTKYRNNSMADVELMAAITGPAHWSLYPILPLRRWRLMMGSNICAVLSGTMTPMAGVAHAKHTHLIRCSMVIWLVPEKRLTSLDYNSWPTYYQGRVIIQEPPTTIVHTVLIQCCHQL